VIALAHQHFDDPLMGLGNELEPVSLQRAVHLLRMSSFEQAATNSPSSGAASSDRFMGCPPRRGYRRTARESYGQPGGHGVARRGHPEHPARHRQRNEGKHGQADGRERREIRVEVAANGAASLLTPG